MECSKSAQKVSVAMAAGSHPFPFRTRKLSPPAPMVLGPKGPGRVGRCRTLLSLGRPLIGAAQVRLWVRNPMSDQYDKKKGRAQSGQTGKGRAQPRASSDSRSGGSGRSSSSSKRSADGSGYRSTKGSDKSGYRSSRGEDTRGRDDHDTKRRRDLQGA